MRQAFSRCIACMLIVCTAGVGLPLPAAAGIITTDRVYASAERDRIRNFLDRAEARAKMQDLGVDADAARARVDALTDDEAAQLAARIDRLPAGGESILGILFAIFIILLVTDILGFTKVFPFTRSIR
ncbi:MAG: PA2779 family protein [Burkholderiales bacterium]